MALGLRDVHPRIVKKRCSPQPLLVGQSLRSQLSTRTPEPGPPSWMAGSRRERLCRRTAASLWSSRAITSRMVSSRRWSVVVIACGYRREREIHLAHGDPLATTREFCRVAMTLQVLKGQSMAAPAKATLPRCGGYAQGSSSARNPGAIAPRFGMACQNVPERLPRLATVSRHHRGITSTAFGGASQQLQQTGDWP